METAAPLRFQKSVGGVELRRGAELLSSSTFSVLLSSMNFGFFLGLVLGNTNSPSASQPGCARRVHVAEDCTLVHLSPTRKQESDAIVSAGWSGVPAVNSPLFGHRPIPCGFPVSFLTLRDQKSVHILSLVEARSLVG